MLVLHDYQQVFCRLLVVYIDLLKPIMARKRYFNDLCKDFNAYLISTQQLIPKSVNILLSRLRTIDKMNGEKTVD